MSGDWIVDLFVKETIEKSLKEPDSYYESGNMVMTKNYHLKRGYCCSNSCRHCPY